MSACYPYPVTLGQGIDDARLLALAFGERQPVADNSTDAGREQNRRVEIKIVPNEVLLASAE